MLRRAAGVVTVSERLEDEARYWGAVEAQALGHAFDAVDLMRADLPEPYYVIDGVLPEGRSVLAGPPKVGKSWAALDIAVAVAAGGRAFGSIPVEQGAVLYAALEDNPRRLQARLGQVLAGEEPNRNLEFLTELPRLHAGGLGILHDWRDRHQDARLIILDTWALVRPRSRPQASIYDEDYAAFDGLNEIATDGLAVVLVHHTRKMDADDPLDTVSGSHGLTGAADAVLVLKRDRGRMDAALHVTGRDVAESEFALEFAPDLGQWRLLGDASEYRRSRERADVLDLLRDAPASTPKEVADALDRPHEGTKKLLARMARDGELDEHERPLHRPRRPVPHVPPVPERDAGDVRDAPPQSRPHVRRPRPMTHWPEAHTDRCYCGRPATSHVTYGADAHRECANVCGLHRAAIQRRSKKHVVVVEPPLDSSGAEPSHP